MMISGAVLLLLWISIFSSTSDTGSMNTNESQKVFFSLHPKCQLVRANCTHLLGSFCPQCDEQGNYLPMQCQDSTDYCWCVDKNGVEIPNTAIRRPPLPNCTGMAASCLHPKCQLVQANCTHLLGSYCPQCDEQGNYLPRQCSPSTGYCWCVDKNGVEIPNTAIRGWPDCGGIAASSLHPNCQLVQANCTYLLGSYCPHCDEQGNYLPRQCSPSMGYCWCVDKNGVEIPNTAIRGCPDCGGMAASSLHLSKCQLARANCPPPPVVGDYCPQCDEQGNYLPMQCWGSTGYCWCVHEDGSKIPNTTIRPPPSPNCTGMAGDGQPPVLQAQLVCESNFMQAGLDRARLEAVGLDPSSAHLADINCTAHQENNGMLWFQVERRGGNCGTQLRTNSTHAIYSNSLFVYPVAVRNGNFSVPERFPFSCVYPLDAEASLDVAIGTNLLGAVVGVGPGPSAAMSLYRNANYTDPYSAGAVVLPLDSALYVGVSVEEAASDKFAVILENCYATPSADPDGSMRLFLIQDRCTSNNRLVNVEDSGPSLPGRFTALVFLFSNDFDTIYLHCSLSMCDPTLAGCSQTCRSRVSRSISDHRVTIGPISWEKKTAR